MEASEGLSVSLELWLLELRLLEHWLLELWLSELSRWPLLSLSLLASEAALSWLLELVEASTELRLGLKLVALVECYVV